MAQCEKCGTNGHDMRDMASDVEQKMFVGPCCIKAKPSLFNNQEVHYGLELSSHMGIRAYASYGGLTVEFKKTKEEVQGWLEKTEQPNPTTQTSTPESEVTLN